jgi:hypothetical protein
LTLSWSVFQEPSEEHALAMLVEFFEAWERCPWIN